MHYLKQRQKAWATGLHGVIWLMLLIEVIIIIIIDR